MTDRIAVLANFHKYGFDHVPVGFVEPSLTFSPKKRLFMLGDGRSREVELSDLIEISITNSQKNKIFPHGI